MPNALPLRRIPILFGLNDKAEIHAVFDDLRTLFARCALFLEHVDRNASVPKQRAILKKLLNDRSTTEDDLWRTDAAVVNRVAMHLRGGGLRLASQRIPPLELRGAMIRALGSIGKLPVGRQVQTDSLALHQFALGLATIWADHSSRPMSRLWRVQWVHGQGIKTHEYGPFHDYIAVVMELVPKHLRTTATGKISGIDYVIRLAIAEHQSAMDCRAPYRRLGLISERRWLGARRRSTPN